MDRHLEAQSAADLILEGLKEAKVEIVACLPESLLKSTYRRISEDRGIHYITVSNEADMPGILVGAYLGGKRAIMMMENSGLRQACEPIARFAFTHHIPLVMMMAFRGGFPERMWWGHSHAQTMVPILDALRIPYWFVRRRVDIKNLISGAYVHADSSQWPVALVFTKECVEVPSYAED